MLFLLAALLQIFSSSATSSVSSAPAILTSSSSNAIVYSCFSNNDSEINLGSVKDACCKGVVSVWVKYDDEDVNNGDDNLSIVLHQRCLSEIAQVPSVVSSVIGNFDNPKNTAIFSWILSRKSNSAVESTSIEQYLWTRAGSDNDDFQRESVTTITPYHNTNIQSLTQNATQPIFMIASKLTSQLGQDGGMHRLYYHNFQPYVNTEGGDEPTYFLYVTIPNGMFIDLDDPIESTAAVGTMQSTPIANEDGVSSEPSYSFVTTTTQPKTGEPVEVSFRARLHAATVCDIEQPSFVSGQHLLVWEIDKITTSTGTAPPVIEFATKLHLRYPHPSPTMEEWIDLPSPLLFAAFQSKSGVPDNAMGNEHNWGLKIAERVWVAAGTDEDHDWIMGMTISFCLVGVAIMLRDISRVSLWDDV